MLLPKMVVRFKAIFLEPRISRIYTDFNSYLKFEISKFFILYSTLLIQVFRAAAPGGGLFGLVVNDVLIVINNGIKPLCYFLTGS